MVSAAVRKLVITEMVLKVKVLCHQIRTCHDQQGAIQSTQSFFFCVLLCHKSQRPFNPLF